MTTTINASTSAGLVNTADTSGILQLQTAGTAALTIDTSQNVGIGTTSPSYKLDVISAGGNLAEFISSASGAGNIKLACTNVSTAGVGYVGMNAYVNNLFGVGTDSSAAVPVAFFTQGAERMRIDSAGKLLVGTTVAASGGGVVQTIVGQGSNDGGVQVTSGTGVSGGGLAMNSLAGGGAKFFSFTGNAGSESYTERMRIDSSGNVGIGTTSPNCTFQVNGIARAATANDKGVISLGESAGGTGVNCGLWRGDANSALSGGIVSTGGNYLNLGGYAGMVFTTGAANIGSQTERMRIDSSGRLLVGVTSPIGSTFSTIQYDAATYNGLGLNQTANTSGGRFMLFASQATQCGVIDRVGTTSAVVYTTTSDRRLKENIVDAPSAIEHINAVKVRSFNWKDDGHQVKYGVIAQEFFEVEPNAVVKGDDGETIEKTWSVDSSVLVPAMIKAIQEQQTIINDLKARIETLEGAK